MNPIQSDTTNYMLVGPDKRAASGGNEPHNTHTLGSVTSRLSE